METTEKVNKKRVHSSVCIGWYLNSAPALQRVQNTLYITKTKLPFRIKAGRREDYGQ